ncbi:MAG: hypothetical protein ABIV51_03250 [Saprospiraceae bacterium]
MRYFLYLGLICIGFGGNSCNRDLGGFLMTYEREFTLPAGLNAINTHYFEIYDVPSLKDQFFAANQVSDPTQFTATGNEGRLYLPLDPGVDLSFIDEIQVMLFKTGQTGIYPTTFERVDVPFTTDDNLLMLAQIPNVMSYLSDEKFHIRIRINLRSPCPQTVTARLFMSYRVLPK